MINVFFIYRGVYIVGIFYVDNKVTLMSAFRPNINDKSFIISYIAMFNIKQIIKLAMLFVKS